MAKNRFITVVVAFVGAAVVAGLFRFNQSATSYNQYIVGNLLGLFFVPVLSIIIVFREDLSKFGFGLTSSKRIWALTGVLFIGALAALAIASHWQGFQNYYPLFRWYPEFGRTFAGYPTTNPFFTDPWMMLYAEATYGMYMFCWEFFFRGYLLFGLMRSIGWGAVLVQAIAFALLHYGKPNTEIAASFGTGIVLGIIAMNSKSFLPCFVIHWAASLSFDAMVVAARPH